MTAARDRAERTGRSPLRDGLLIVCGVALFFDAALYSVLTPLLARYADRFMLSTTETGILSASFYAGLSAGSIASGAVVVRAGCKIVTTASAVVVAGSAVGFALAGDVYVMLATRCVQGAASALLWAAALTWVSRRTPLLAVLLRWGALMAMGMTGSIAGPLLGVVAAASSTVSSSSPSPRCSSRPRRERP